VLMLGTVLRYRLTVGFATFAAAVIVALAGWS